MTFRGESAAELDDEIRTFGDGGCLVEGASLLGGSAALIGIGIFLWRTYQLAENMNISYLEAGNTIINLLK
ncbi:hypothetical protein A2187_00990 [Candidatus Collierbacteria bacterium RIFOXYA1_FULL_46_24]|uniref:Uncharacterized protein n=2 Tax=Candidatus Collieribacteriota TaxID=1752725 RepID=A0A1F5FXR5_9BACT|nr:MAG: hypothetical protein A2187_00990 [Candidatus Collierbacteria bacterium RIFOXYA1_FULL_46_24]OGD74188.1 MAG: hypothetical protein A2228_03295 [Candidatus Collierbacteria bacterium RIFOXYA2_FULL_46_10]OGD84391.1 MAG: hypothetical protein A2618_01890 [Candidatus Collierbacteria bacterium RIFOXYD1_FULL_46_26]